MSDEEKPSFACDECEQSFPKAHGLKIHRSKMHKKKKSARKEESPSPQTKKKKKVESTPDGHEESSSSHDGEEKAVVKPKKKEKKEAEDDERRSPAKKKKNEEKALPKKKAASPKKDDSPFNVGDLLEGENNDPELPLYLDTIHEVEYVGPSGKDTHRCRMLAFHGRPIYEWNTHELHDKRRVKEEEFQVGERVHVLIKNRWGINEKGKRVGDLDGHSAKVGVWVKATVLEVGGDGRIKVEHANWNASADKKKKTSTTQAHFDPKDVRKDWHNN